MIFFYRLKLIYKIFLIHRSSPASIYKSTQLLVKEKIIYQPIIKAKINQISI